MSGKVGGIAGVFKSIQAYKKQINGYIGTEVAYQLKI